MFTKMEALTALASNGWISLAAIIVIIIIFLFAIKKGLISFNGKGLKVGESNDRTLIRNQWEYANSSCEAQYVKIRPYCKSDEEAKYLIARTEDVFQSAIIYNYMTEAEDYVKAKQALVLQAIQKRSSNEHFFSDDFKSCCYRFTENLIKDLVRMKRLYK